MSYDKQDKKKILEMVKNEVISPEDALKLIRGINGRDNNNVKSGMVTEKISIQDKDQGEEKAEERSKLVLKRKDAAMNSSKANGNTEDIAIIGISGRFPGAANIEEFWRNLSGGVNSVTQIPKDRWDIDEFYHPDINEPNKTYCKFGGMLSDFDKFDPLFFSISPLEAELMDPQHRLFLQESWKALEHAGYGEHELWGEKCAVFAGVAQGDYLSNIKSSGSSLNTQVLTGYSNNMLAARISYHLNLTGANMPIDTACSASLVAIHQACRSIVSGESVMAIAGGACILSTPEMHIMASKGGMLSKTGQCKTFDNAADGFVPGEAVGVVVLKRLDKAVSDGDTIYGVIKGSEVNYDGKTNGITAPSVVSQTKLQTEVYEKFDIAPETISYIETHGTGTKLGDPIEINALKNSFRKFTDKKNFCALGSVKANIGHAMTAAGVAGFIKVLLCMKYKKMVPLPHFKKLNEHIKLKDSPFYVNTELTDWKQEAHTPRRAAISSFGLSGTNCHIVVQESPISKNIDSDVKLPWYFIPFSAKTQDAIVQKLKDMISWLAGEGREQSLSDISHTLCKGRSHFHVRAAAVVKDMKHLIKVLEGVLNGEKLEEYMAGEFEPDMDTVDPVMEGLGKEIVSRLSAGKLKEEEIKSSLSTLSEIYIKGITPDFDMMFRGMRVKRVALPTYPFAAEKYWIPYKSGLNNKPEGTGHYKSLHPLIGENISMLKVQKYATRFTGNEFFFTDHMVKGKKVFPGVAYIEMARAAAELATGNKTTKIRDMLWLKPLFAGEYELETRILLKPGENFITFEVMSENESILHATGRIELNSLQETSENADIDAIKARTGKLLDSDTCYKIHSSRGIVYKDEFRTVRELYTNGQEAIALLDLPETAEKYMLHPGLMDGALQTVAGLDMFSDISEGKSLLPFSVEEIEIYGAVKSKSYAHAVVKARENGGFKADIYIYGPNGSTLAKIKNIVSRPSEQLIAGAERANTEIVYLREVWKEKKIEDNKGVAKGNGAVLIFCHSHDIYETFAGKINNQGKQHRDIYFIRPGERFNEDDDNTFTINPSNEEDYLKMVALTRNSSGLIADVVHLWSEGKTAYDKDIKKQLDMGVNSLFNLTKALIMSRIEENINVLHVFVCHDDTSSPLDFAVGGFAKSVRLEKPNIRMKSVKIDILKEEKSVNIPQVIADTVLEELGSSDDGETRVSYFNGVRSTTVLGEVNPNTMDSVTALKDGGVYIITGGAGGLGLIFANYIACSVRAKIVLIGRSEPGVENTAEITRMINSSKSEVRYLKCDISQKNEVESIISKLKSEYGRIDGVIHSAGVIQDSFILNKTLTNMEKVLEPKIIGLINIDQSLKDEKLDFFVLFSAVASVFGNYGQSDYAYANSFLDEYAKQRAELTRKKLRYGKTVSINWPLWMDGGMKIDKQQEDALFNRLGMTPLETSKGITAFETAIANNESQIGVLEGNAEIIRNCDAVKGVEFKISKSNFISKASSIDNSEENILIQTEMFLKGIFARFVKMAPDKIKPEVAFEKYGIDSIIIVGINSELEKHFGKLSKTLLFEYRSLKELTHYFINNQKEKLYEKFNINTDGKKAEVQSEGPENTRLAACENREVYDTRFLKEEKRNPDGLQGAYKGENSEDIAIIGVSGRYPMADNLDEFWKNMIEAKDCISEIPKERWDNEIYYDSDKNAIGKTYTKWGGFIKDADKFDPFFFNISPREAENMDPQERIFLETAYKSVEDAGYRRGDLEGKPIGVFVGVMYGSYQLAAMDEFYRNGSAAVNTSFSSIANRVSYYFNLNGPSIAIDTMCSSSLTALHLACESIKRGESQSAIVGGVNLSLHVMKYLVLSQGKFASTDGRCRSFGMGGDGYVPGEGVGAVYLKPLKNALKDGDSIYAVIKATAINHGGRSNGYTVPNPNAQASLIAEAIKKSGINPRTISHMEAHGTGTALGDPIEITGLKKAFEEFTSVKQFCSIGSVKSNIGHLESAAGIAGLTKVILEMKNKTLVASIHSNNLNANIDFEDSAFYVQQESAEWKKPKIKEGDSFKEYPRRAAISAFGAGGSNAHVILEEYETFMKPQTAVDGRPLVFVFSARSEERLKVYAGEVISFLSSVGHAADRNTGNPVHAGMENDLKNIIAKVLYLDPSIVEPQDLLFEYGADNVKISEIASRVRDEFDIDLNLGELMENCSLNGIMTLLNKYGSKNVLHTETGISLKNMAYTLQVGREAMEERLAIIASCREELVEALTSFCEGKENINVYRGSIKQVIEENKPIIDGQEGREFIKALLSAGKISRIAALWVKGADIDWSVLYGTDDGLTRISTPTYPFLRKRYWIGSYNNEKDKFGMRPGIPQSVKKEDNTAEKVAARATPDWESMAEGYDGDEVNLEIINDCIALVRMQDRKYKNGFSDQIITGLIAAFSKIKRNSSIKVVVLTGYDNVFSMGGTKNQLNDIAEQKSKFTDAPFLYRGLLETDIPVITAMQGHASGGGMLFGLYGDIILMAEEGVYSAVFTKYGFTPGMGATYILKERFGGNLANEMMFTAKSFTGAELKERGVSVLVKRSGEVLQEALKIAEMLSEKPLQTLRVLKMELAGRLLENLMEFIRREEQMHRITFTQPEVKDRIKYYYLDSEGKAGTKVVENDSEQADVNDKKLKISLSKTTTAIEKQGLTVSQSTSGIMSYVTAYNQEPMEEWVETKKSDLKFDINEDEVNEKVAGIVGNILHISPSDLNDTAIFKDLGVDSISGVEIIRDINKSFDLNLDAVTLYDYPSIKLMTSYIIKTCLKNSSNVQGVIQNNLDYMGLNSEKASIENPAENLSENERIMKSKQSFNPIEKEDAVIEGTLKDIVGNILHIPGDEVDVYTSFKEMGVDSISGVEIIRDINKNFNINLDAVLIYDYPNVVEMTKHIKSKASIPAALDEVQEAWEDSTYEEVAAAAERNIEQGIDVKSSFFFRSSATYGRDIRSAGASNSVVGNNSVSAPDIMKDKPAEGVIEIRKPLHLKNTHKMETEERDCQIFTSVADRIAKPNIIDMPIENKEEKSGGIRKSNLPVDIAIIGISGRFPGAENVHRYWNNLKNGVESITEVPKERWNVNDYFDPNPRTPNKTYSRVGGFLKDADKFDPLFFNISPLEAEAMDPQQRIFLEEAWRALEDAGYADRSLSNVKCGVFVGAAQGDYVSKLSLGGAENTAEAFAGMSSSILAARISYILNLKGPSIAMDTACSSSLVAVHQACLSILSGESDMALAGGIRLMFTPSLYIQTCKMEMLSLTGKCRAFDHRADGTIMSEGAGVIVLKPLDKAIKDRDYIYGVIKGSGTNQDGKTNGITAPSAQAQTQLELDVYRRHGINPGDITYIEAHGTGTRLGDPIEVKALKDAFGEFVDKKQFCAIGSVKTNIGHATMAAGVAGIIKILLSMKYKMIPPSLNFEKENEHIKFEETPFYVNTKLTDWAALDGKRRMAAISGFGFSGTNCHIVIEEYPT